MPETFPILSPWQWERNVPKDVVSKIPRHVPWALVADHERQAARNHDQSLARLAQRGGLSPAELYCVVNDATFYKPGSPMDCTTTEHAACLWLLEKLGISKE